MRMNGRYRLRRSDIILTNFFRDFLRSQRIPALMFEDRWVIDSEGSLKLKKGILRFLAENMKRQQS